MREPIGKKLSPILTEIENTLWEYEANSGNKPRYEENAVRASVKILMSVLMDKMWELQEEEDMGMEQRMEMSNKAGEEIRQLIKTYTNIDMHEAYK